MENFTDHAWTSLRINKTDFFEGVYTFNGCQIIITKRQDPYRYETGTGKPSTMSARFWGKIVFPTGEEENFEEAILQMWDAIKKYNPETIGYQWDFSNPRIQLEPIGARGYIELHPVKSI